MHRQQLDSSITLTCESLIDSQVNEYFQFIIKERKCQVQTKDQEPTQKQTFQQHHQKAAEHHDEASNHHKEAGKCCESNDHKSAAHHAQIAQGHTTKAAEQGAKASKKYAKTRGSKN